MPEEELTNVSEETVETVVDEVSKHIDSESFIMGTAVGSLVVMAGWAVGKFVVNPVVRKVANKFAEWRESRKAITVSENEEK